MQTNSNQTCHLHLKNLQINLLSITIINYFFYKETIKIISLRLKAGKMLVKDILKKDNNSIVIIRIFLSCLVLFSHAFPLTGKGKAEPFSIHLGMSAGSIAVNGFFFLAGMLILKSYTTRNNPLSYFTARIFRILPALIVATIILALICGPLLTTLSVDDYFHNKEVRKFIRENIQLNIQFYLPGVFEHLVYPKAINGSWWSIPIEFNYYIILMFMGMLGFFKNRYIASTILIFFIIALYTKVAFIFDNYFSSNVYYAYAAISFSMGCLFWLWADYIKINIYSFIGILGLLYIFKWYSIFPFLLLLAFGIFILYFSSRKWILKLKNFPDISYGIYIWGFFVQQLLVFNGINRIKYNFFLSTIICIILGYFSFKYIENPAIKLGRKISSKYFSKFDKA